MQAVEDPVIDQVRCRDAGHQELVARLDGQLHRAIADRPDRYRHIRAVPPSPHPAGMRVLVRHKPKFAHDVTADVIERRLRHIEVVPDRIATDGIPSHRSGSDPDGRATGKRNQHHRSQPPSQTIHACRLPASPKPAADAASPRYAQRDSHSPGPIVTAMNSDCVFVVSSFKHPSSAAMAKSPAVANATGRRRLHTVTNTPLSTASPGSR